MLTIHRYELAILDPRHMRWRVFQGIPERTEEIYSNLAKNAHPHWQTAGQVLAALHKDFSCSPTMPASTTFASNARSEVTLPAFELSSWKADSFESTSALEERFKKQVIQYIGQTLKFERVNVPKLVRTLGRGSIPSTLSLSEAIALWNSLPVLYRWDSMGTLSGMRNQGIAMLYNQWPMHSERWVAYELTYPRDGAIHGTIVTEITGDMLSNELSKSFIPSFLDPLQDREQLLYRSYAGLFDKLVAEIAPTGADPASDTTVCLFIRQLRVLQWPCFLHIVAAPNKASVTKECRRDASLELLRWLNSPEQFSLLQIRDLLASSVTARFAFWCADSAHEGNEELMRKGRLLAANIHHINPFGHLSAPYGYEECVYPPTADGVVGSFDLLSGLWQAWVKDAYKQPAIPADSPWHALDSTATLLAEGLSSVGEMAIQLRKNLIVTHGLSSAMKYLEDARENQQGMREAVFKINPETLLDVIQAMASADEEAVWSELVQKLPPSYAKMFEGSGTHVRKLRDLLRNEVKEKDLTLYSLIGRLYSLRPIHWLDHWSVELTDSLKQKEWSAVAGLNHEIQWGKFIADKILTDGNLSTLNNMLRLTPNRLMSDVTSILSYLNWLGNYMERMIGRTLSDTADERINAFNVIVRAKLELGKSPKSSCNDGCDCEELHFVGDKKWWYMQENLIALRNQRHGRRLKVKIHAGAKSDDQTREFSATFALDEDQAGSLPSVFQEAKGRLELPPLQLKFISGYRSVIAVQRVPTDLNR